MLGIVISAAEHILLDRLLPIVTADGYEIEVVDKRLKWGFSFNHVTKDSYSMLVGQGSCRRATY